MQTFPEQLYTFPNSQKKEEDRECGSVWLFPSSHGWSKMCGGITVEMVEIQW